MSLKNCKILLISFCLLAVSVSISATQRFLIVAPGESYSGTSAKTGSPLPQVDGVPFAVSIVSYDDALFTPMIATNQQVSMTANNSSTITPVNTFTLNQAIGSTANCLLYPVTITFTLGDSGNVVIAANNVPSPSIAFGSETITAQAMTKFAFATIPPGITAGVAFPIYITAQTAANATVTGFNGQATLTANYIGLGAVSLGTVTFVNGIYSGNVTLYDASAGNVTLTITSTTPSATANSAGFSVAAGAINSLLMVAPGETYAGGTNGGIGKTGTPNQQTAGTPFYVTVYVTDAEWNTVTTATTINMASSDPNVVFTPVSQAASNGSALFAVTLKTVASGSQTVTASRTGGGATAATDTIPLTFAATVDHFNITNTIGTLNAGQLFQVHATAVDAYNNTVTTFSTLPTVSFFTGAVALPANHYAAPTGVSSSGGLITFSTRIYQAILNNANVQITSSTTGSASGTTNNFTVNAGAYVGLDLVCPGQTFDQGNHTGGLSGTPNAATAGIPYTIVVYAVDNYGNQIANNDAVNITSLDILALINGTTQPQSINLSGGTATFGVTFKTGGVMSVTGTDTTDVVDGNPSGSCSINVLASNLASFQLLGVSSQTTAGSNFTLQVIATDQYKNTKTNFTGTVYISSTTDWTLPYETTMAISGANTSLDNYKWAVVFQASDNGVKNLTADFLMATTNVQAFASDNFNDTPSSSTGHTGISVTTTVIASTPVKLQILPLGVQARPGTADGINNTPTGEGVNTDFPCTVNLTDAYWNVVTGGGDATDQINITSNDQSNTKINDVSIAVTPQSVFLAKGTATFNAYYGIQSSSFYLIVSDATQGSIASNPPAHLPIDIAIYTIKNITITAPGGGNLTDVYAGTAFSISMTAYSSIGVVATGFNGTVNISAPSDYTTSENTIAPTTSIAFSGGVAVMQVAIYRAYANDVVRAQFGATQFGSNSFNVNPGPVTGIQVIPDGMSNLAGLNNVGIPGYIGYASTPPNVVEAGSGHEFTIFYVDNYYNQVTIASGTCQVTSTDPNATVDGNSLLYLAPIVSGEFQSASGFVLRTVGLTGQQSVTATDNTNGSLKDTSPEILVRHTTYNNFTVLAPTTAVTAGIPFNITITAYDAYGNICDDTNGGVPFNSTVSLSDDSVSGANTMLPNTYPLTKGLAVASTQLFEAHSSNTHITAQYNTASGISNAITINPNNFKRLFVTTTGMSPKPGFFTDPVSMQFLMYDPTKPPFWTSGGGSNTTIVNDAAHTPTGYVFTIYACDAYGNIVTGSADVLGQTVTVATNDLYAIPVTPVAINETTGQATVNLIFHTAMTGVSVTADYTNINMQNFTTPTFTTLAGTPYGIQMLVPGLTVNNGAGNWNTAGAYWDNGIIGTASAELSTQPFPVTIQVSDIYGNFTTGNNDHIKITGPAPNSYVLATSFPTVANSFTGQVGDAYPGAITLTAHIDVTATDNISLNVSDIDNGALNVTCYQNPTSVNVITGGNLGFLVYARATSADAWTNTVNVITTAAPNTFGFEVTVDSGGTSIPVYGAVYLFNCTPVSVDTLTVLGGTLGIPSATTTNLGSYITMLQSYTDATSFRIKVSDPTNALSPKYSPIIVMGANPNSVTFTVSAQNQNVRANTATNVYGRVVDGNGNPVIGVNVTFNIQSGNGVFDPVSNTQIASALTDATGTAVVQFYGSYQNEVDTIMGNYNGKISSVKIEVSVVAPILGQVSNYPNPFKAGAENTNISYLMDTNQNVKITIYNLFGDLVFNTSINAGSPGATAGMNTFVWNGKNNKGQVVGNGGYICVVNTVIQNATKNKIRKSAVAK